MKSLSEVIADFYIEKNIISSDMKSVYVYGISLIINDIIDFAVILIPAIIARRFIYGVAFLLTFCITRIHCGGFHAKKSWICAGVMLLTFILVCLCTELTASIYGVILNMIINSISILIILPIIPIENPNKKLENRNNCDKFICNALNCIDCIQHTGRCSYIFHIIVCCSLSNGRENIKSRR